MTTNTLFMHNLQKTGTDADEYILDYRMYNICHKIYQFNEYDASAG